MNVLRTVCNRDCPDACAILARVEDGRVTRLSGDPEHPITRGTLCFRTSRFLARQYSAERLTRPLLRKGGRLVEVPFDEAMDFVAARLLAIRAELGPAAIFHYRSGGSLGLLKTLADYFFEQFGPVTNKRGDICGGAGDAAQETDFGVSDSNDLLDLLASKHILLWGKNPVVSSPHTLVVLRDARARGAHLTLIDPVRHKTAAHVDAYHAVRPGADFALAMAVAGSMFERGLVDPAAASYCDHLDRFEAMARQRSVAEWSAIADLAPRVAEDLADRLADGPTAILVGWGLGRRSHGAAAVRALDALGAISGNLGVSGGGVSFYFKRRGAFDTSLVTGRAPRSIAEPLFGEQLLAAADPPIRAVWITAGNPVAMLPDSGAVARALESRDLVVVVDSFLTDTAARAHVVFPTTTLLEDDDLLGAYGHHYLGASTPVVAPPGEVRSDLEVLQALAARTGLAEQMAGDARAWKRRLIRPETGLSLEDLETRAVRNPLAPRVLFADRVFATPSGRVNLIAEAPPLEARDPEFPLGLMSLSTEKSQSAQWATEIAGPLPATVHPEAAGGLPDGARAILESRLGSMEVVLRLDASQRRDVVIVPKGGTMARGHAANRLVRARLTDLGEGGALYDEGVRLRPA